MIWWWIEQSGWPLGELPPVSVGAAPVHVVRQEVQLPDAGHSAHGPPTRPRTPLPLRALPQNIQRPLQFAASHPLQSRRRPSSRLSRKSITNRLQLSQLSLISPSLPLISLYYILSLSQRINDIIHYHYKLCKLYKLYNNYYNIILLPSKICK